MDANRRDVAAALRTWTGAGRPVVLATVVSSSGSAPRGLGAQLAIAGPQEWVGALSGGCTEAAVIGEAERLLAADDECAAAYVAYSKETLADVGPVCGSTLGVVVERVDADLVAVLADGTQRAIAGEDMHLVCAWEWDGASPTTVTDVEPGQVWSMRRASCELRAADAARAAGVRVVEATLDGTRMVADQWIGSSIHLVVGGGGDIARELFALAGRLAWRTTLLDPRARIAEQTAAGVHVDDVVVGWPDAAWEGLGVDARAACVALAHESHLDEPFLAQALRSAAFYVGAVGSRRVQAGRRDALAPLVDAVDLARLRGPAGLDLGGHAAAEIALAIVAEIVGTSNGRVGTPLADSSGPIRAT